MLKFFYSLGENIEAFFSTPLAALLGTFFVVILAALTLFLIKYFENK